VEPFLGSGVVAFNLAPDRALVADTNTHLIQFYRDIASGVVNGSLVREYLESEGAALSIHGEDYFYEVRERFNSNPTSLDFLFLSRACFNGVMRFNRKGHFNVPFCKKPDRFAPSYITKIANQVDWVSRVLRDRDWVFEVADWKDTLAQVREGDFVYADPPYAGRHTDYYNKWTDEEAASLFDSLLRLPAGFALSTWSKNKYRSNPHLDSVPPSVVVRTYEHFYHVGSTEDLRNAMEEALVISKADGFRVAESRR